MNSREKALLTFLLVSLFAIVTVVGYAKLYRPAYEKAERAKAQAIQEEELARINLMSADTMEADFRWLEDTAQDPKDPRTVSEEFVSRIRNSGRRRGISVDDIEITPLDILPEGLSHRVRVKVRMRNGKERQVLPWVHDLTDPGQRQVVTRLMYETRPDGESIRCEFEVEGIVTLQTEEY